MTVGIVQEHISLAVGAALEQAKGRGLLTCEKFPSITIEVPKREEWGDFSSTIAIALAKEEKRPPQAVAELLASCLRDISTLIIRVDVVAPGFLNFTVDHQLWFTVLQEIEEKGEAYGWNEMGQGKRVLLEYVSANPTGPLHVGHGRGAVLGDALGRVLQASGFVVKREFYINDAGRQMKLLADSVFARYQELFGKAVTFPDDGYQGDYIRTVAKHVSEKKGASLLEQPLDDALATCGRLAYEELLQTLKEDLEAFGVIFDVWYSENSLLSSGKVRQALETLKKKDLVFEKEGALWFRSTQFQDEKDRVVLKQDGDYTYLATDIAYHQDKLERGYDELINIWGADHHGYIPRIQGTLQAFGYPKDRFQVVLVQMVSLLRNGKKVEMSKRAGEFVTLRDVIDEVSTDAARFFFLMRRADTHLDFDLDLAKKRSAENPVFYVQYAHARLASLFRNAEERGLTVPSVQETDLTFLEKAEELRLIKYLSQYPAMIFGCARTLEPHRVIFYLQELAALLHAFYNKYRVLPPRDGGERDEDDGGLLGVTIRESSTCSEALSPQVTAARLVLLRQVQTVIRNGLGLLGVSAPEKM